MATDNPTTLSNGLQPGVYSFAGTTGWTTYAGSTWTLGNAALGVRIPSQVEDGKLNNKENKIMDLRVGDKVRLLSPSGCGSLPQGYEGTVADIDIYGYVWLEGHHVGSDAHKWSKPYSELELINSAEAEETNKSMLQPLSALSNLIQRTFSEDTKTLYRAGYLSADLNITDKLTNAVGEMFVGHIIDGTIEKATFASFASELIAKAKEEIAEAEKKEKKS